VGEAARIIDEFVEEMAGIGMNPLRVLAQPPPERVTPRERE